MQNIKTVAIALTVLLLSSYNEAIGAGRAEATASVSIINSISNSTMRDLSFGEVAIPKSGFATIIISPEEATSVSGTANYAGQQNSAKFQVNGTANSNYSIIVPSNVQITNGSESLTLNDFTHSYGNNDGTISADGQDTFYVGASLDISENTQIGFYSGTFSVTVDYH